MFATTDTTGANTTADGLPTFTTTPVRVPMLGAGCRDIELRINTITSVAGFVAVELRTADGRALPGYGLASSNQIKGNFIGTEPQSSCRSVPTTGLTAPLWEQAEPRRGAILPARPSSARCALSLGKS